MSKLKENLIDLSFLISIPVLGLIYPLLNNTSNGVRSLVTDADKAIPFVKEFIIPYVLWYPFIFACLLYFYMKDRRTYFRTLISINIGMIISFIIYFTFQTHVPRPILEGEDLLTKLVLIIYKGDNPYNCFPSIHVLESYLMIKGIYDCRNKIGLAVITIDIMSTLIILATMFVKQHVLLDVLGGIYLGEIVFNYVSKFEVLLGYKRKPESYYTSNLDKFYP
jgi:membrane-associated phospholipid phosphatase